jgi:cephalosporin hydroxylase
MDTLISYLNHCDLFIGISSGISWLSWALNKETVIISGFSKPVTEPLDDNIIRVFKGGGCNGCFNRSRLDAGDWNWCPDQKGTPRQFECTKIISSKDVLSAINDYYNKEKNIELIVQESYDLGMVQNHKEILAAANFFKKLNVKNFMEIGTDQGGSFAIWSKLSEDGIRISVDLPHGMFGRTDYDENERDNYLRSLGSNVHMYWGSSHDINMLKLVEEKLDTILLDFMFIDGDHTYEGVKADFEMYKHLVRPGGWIAFHDIKDTEFHRRSNCRVDKLWSELQGVKHEFIDCTSDYGGIGFIQV